MPNTAKKRNGLSPHLTPETRKKNEAIVFGTETSHGGRELEDICPTCWAKPGERCIRVTRFRLKLSTQTRRKPHRERLIDAHWH